MKAKEQDSTIRTSCPLEGLVECYECNTIVKASEVIWVPQNIDCSRKQIPSKLVQEIDAKAMALPVLKFYVMHTLIPICKECNEIIWSD